MGKIWPLYEKVIHSLPFEIASASVMICYLIFFEIYRIIVADQDVLYSVLGTHAIGSIIGTVIYFTARKYFDSVVEEYRKPNGEVDMCKWDVIPSIFWILFFWGFLAVPSYNGAKPQDK